MPQRRSLTRSQTSPTHDDGSSVVRFHLLGCIPYDTCAQLQKRLVAEAIATGESRSTVLLAEHPAEITVGRRGSRRHVRLSPDQLSDRGLSIRWVPRGGGCVLHSPGQLAIYPIVPLGPRQWTFSEFRRRIHRALVDTLQSCGYENAPTLPGAGIWGRTGCLAVSGIGESSGVTHHGAWLNVHPECGEFPSIDVVPPDQVDDQVCTTMSSLLAEHRRPVRMTTIRAAVVEKMSAAFDCESPHLFTGHPLVGPGR
jgi:lipoyl(octanoyl) transferase